MPFNVEDKYWQGVGCDLGRIFFELYDPSNGGLRAGPDGSDRVIPARLATDMIIRLTFPARRAAALATRFFSHTVYYTHRGGGVMD